MLLLYIRDILPLSSVTVMLIFLLFLAFQFFICWYFEAEPSEKSVEIMRKFSEQYARRSNTYFCVDKSVTSVVIKVFLPFVSPCSGCWFTSENCNELCLMSWRWVLVLSEFLVYGENGYLLEPWVCCLFRNI